MDITGLTETNVHWKRHHITKNFYNILKDTQPEEEIGTCTLESNLSWSSDYKPGGTTMLSLNNLTSATINKGQDSSGLGRWTFLIHYWKKNNGSETTIFTRYRPCNSPIESVGGSTVIKQQWLLLQE